MRRERGGNLVTVANGAVTEPEAVSTEERRPVFKIGEKGRQRA